MTHQTARVVVREGCKKPYSIICGSGWLRANGQDTFRKNPIKTFATREAAQRVADEINARNFMAFGISVESATTELVCIGPAHPDYRG